ncbi:MAG TPA: hypothetical protein VK668_21990 [Mucilaginibacter sp.]|nr:hypothetical protein [Mucilaginibacter sp.]
MPAFEGIYGLWEYFFLFRQQNSFGRNQTKQWWTVGWKGIANFAKPRPSAARKGQYFAARGFD